MDLNHNSRIVLNLKPVNGRLIIQASNIHQGGGRILLLALLEALVEDRERHILVMLDKRLQIDASLVNQMEVIRVVPTLLGRLRAEWTVAKRAKKGDLLLCFGNLPPLFPVRSRVVLFLQNFYLIGRASTLRLPLRLKIRLQLERFWLQSTVHRCHVVTVQGLSMRRLVNDSLGIDAVVAPFARPIRQCEKFLENKPLDFLYIANGEPHKNHRRLIEAWIYLASYGIFPSLGLTLDYSVNASLCKWIQSKVSIHSLRIDMLGTLSAAEVENTYLSSRALIYPSLFESFGLPLLEARSFSLPILASERDYVRDLITPVESFDPESNVSIARAVMRYLHLPEEKTVVMTAQEFQVKILSGSWNSEANIEFSKNA